MKFVFIAKHRNIWPVAWLCDAMGVSRSGFHAWLNRSPSARSRSDETVGQQVKASFIASDRTYGARRVWRDLLAEGIECGLHRIERLMRLQALRARPRRRRLPKDEGDRQVATVPSNLLDRQFEAQRPNQKWIADFTYIWTDEGWLYVSAVIDLFSRRVVGWSMSAGMTAQLVADALLMAVWRRGKPNKLLHHSDQGSQYTSEQFQRLMADSGIVCSSKCVYDADPDTSPPPTDEAVVACGIRTKQLGQITPRCSRAQDPEDAIEDTMVANPRNPTRLVRQHGLDGIHS